MKTIYHPAESRGRAEHGWLSARHSFSFANYYNPERMSFGLLRVLNDDIVAPGRGFDTHPHNNMEIITIPLEGSLEHRDNMGNGSVIGSGEVQVMSAGKGVMHSEFNPSGNETLNLLQIWIFPEQQDVEPRYDQRKFDPETFQDSIQAVVNNDTRGPGLFIHQKAVLSLCRLSVNKSAGYRLHYKNNGVYVFMIEGKTETAGHTLLKRDGLGISEAKEFTVSAIEDSTILFLEVPMR